MSRYSKQGRIAKCGSPDSKYMSRLNVLDEDITAKMLEHDVCIKAIKDIVLANPAKMQSRYYDVIDALKELKEEYNL